MKILISQKINYFLEESTDKNFKMFFYDGELLISSFLVQCWGGMGRVSFQLASRSLTLENHHLPNIGNK